MTSVDLPAFGRPTTAIWIGRPAGSAGPSPASSTPSSISSSTSTISTASGNPSATGSSARSRSSMPMPCSADSATGSPSPSSQASISPASAARPSALLATRITFAARLRSSSASVRSTGVTPARASIMNRQTSAAAIARSVSARIRPGRLASVASSSPAVSITVKRSAPSRPGALAQVARHPGLVVDQRQPPADQPVEQRRLADVRPADDGEGEGHRPRLWSPGRRSLPGRAGYWKARSRPSCVGT